MRHTPIRRLLPGAALASGLLLALACTASAGAGAATPDPDAAQASERYWPPAPVVPLESEPDPVLIVDTPLREQLDAGLVVIRYTAENLRFVPVYGQDALDVSPRIGHIHVTVDDAAWHWADAGGEPIIIQGLEPGPHEVLIELADPTHQVLDSETVGFEVPDTGGGGHH